MGSVGRERERNDRKESWWRVVDLDRGGCFSFGFPERERKLREREGVVEKERERERETELGVTVREKEGLGLREGGETVNSCHRRDFEDLGHGGPSVARWSLSLSPHSFSL